MKTRRHDARLEQPSGKLQHTRKANILNSSDVDRAFAGSIPQLYDTYLVPLIFEPYADDMASRVATHGPSRVLEVAAGTGVVTRRLANILPRSVSIVATDLNQSMLDQANSLGTSRPVEWRQADAMHLPYPDASFDLIVCQFGVMFFPNKAEAFAEARRVLCPGGTLVFNVWDRIDQNEFADTVTAALATLFPADPPRFMARVPHGYHDVSLIARDVALGGFSSPAEFTTITARSRASTPRIPAVAYCQGTPLRSEIEARGSSRLEEATSVAAEAIARRYGAGAIDAKIQAHVVSIGR
jgi:SAM-dependent methyltransferase